MPPQVRQKSAKTQTYCKHFQAVDVKVTFLFRKRLKAGLLWAGETISMPGNPSLCRAGRGRCCAEPMWRSRRQIAGVFARIEVYNLILLSPEPSLTLRGWPARPQPVWWGVELFRAPKGKRKSALFLDMFVFNFSRYNSDSLCGRYVKGPNVQNSIFHKHSAVRTQKWMGLGGITEAFWGVVRLQWDLALSSFCQLA